MKMKYGKVAIILVNYNGEKYNIECIESIKKSSYKNYQIYFIDNKSSDNSVDQIKKKKYSNMTIIENKKNMGFSEGNNIGIKKANLDGCQFILLLNNDTSIKENMIENLIKTSYDNELAVVAPKIYYYDNKEIIWSAGGGIDWNKGLPIQYGINQADSIEYSKMKEIEFATGCCMLIPMQVINKIGLMSKEYFLYYEDTDYSMKIQNAGFKLLYQPSAMMYHKVSASTGGEESKLYIYYMSRNRMIFNKKYNKKYKLAKLYMYVTLYIKSVFWILKGKKNKLEMVKLGMKDFNENRLGKVEYFE